MARRDAARGIIVTGMRHPAAALVLIALGQSAGAADPIAASSQEAGQAALESGAPSSNPLLSLGAWDPALTAAVLPDADFAQASPSAAAPAQELATGLGIQVEKKRRKFRQRAVNWMSDRSASVGTMTDFLLGGADSGWHLVVDPSGTDEYILQWKARFR